MTTETNPLLLRLDLDREIPFLRTRVPVVHNDSGKKNKQHIAAIAGKL